jgi:putative MATE family efflux protein
VLRGAGDAFAALRALCLANCINIVLDPCLIFGLGPFPELGLTGAAWATLIGRGTGVLYQFHVLRRGKSRIVLRPPLFEIEPRVLGEIVRLSIGGVLQFLIATSSWIVLMRFVAPYGDAALAGYTIAIRVIVVALLPSFGLTNAAATLVGQNLGANRPDRAERSVWITGWYNTAFLVGVTLIFFFASDLIIAWFTDNPETAEHGASALRIISSGYVFYAWGVVMVQAFNGAGDTMTPTRINFFCFWLFQIPLAWTLSRVAGLGPRGVFWSVVIAETVLALVAIALFRRGKWKEVKLAPDVETGSGVEEPSAVIP